MQCSYLNHTGINEWYSGLIQYALTLGFVREAHKILKLFSSCFRINYEWTGWNYDSKSSVDRKNKQLSVDLLWSDWEKALVVTGLVNWDLRPSSCFIPKFNSTKPDTHSTNITLTLILLERTTEGSKESERVGLLSSFYCVCCCFSTSLPSTFSLRSYKLSQ